jgi:type IV pilus assembly protein PilM
LTDDKKKRDIAATNQLLEVIRGEKATLEGEGPDLDEQGTAADEKPAVYVEKRRKRRSGFSLFATRTVGLDVGSHTIKCVCLEKRGLKHVALLGVEAVEISQFESHQQDENGADAQVRAIRHVMENIRSHRAKVVSSVGGVSTAVRQVELPKMSAKELSSSINLWARNYMPFDIKEVQLDYQVFGFDRNSRKIRLILVAVIKDYVQKHIDVLHEAHIDPVLVDVNPLAVMNVFLFNEETRDDQCIIVLDVGDRNTTLCIYSEQDQYFVRNLMISGNDFTRDIQRGLGLPYGDVERYKRGEIVVGEKNGPSPKLIDVIKPSMDALIKEVRRSLTYYENQTRTRGFSQIVLTGGSVQMEKFADYLGENLGLPVKILDPFKEIGVGEISIPGPPSQFALAVGLALREHK